MSFSISRGSYDIRDRADYNPETGMIGEPARPVKKGTMNYIAIFSRENYEVRFRNGNSEKHVTPWALVTMLRLGEEDAENKHRQVKENLRQLGENVKMESTTVSFELPE